MAEIHDPYKKYRYRVSLDDGEEAGFSEVSSPEITEDPVEYREGGIAGKTPRKHPGQLWYSNVTLKRGATESRAFADWMKEIQNGRADRKTVIIALMDDEMNDAAAWRLEKAWPTKYMAPDFTAASNEVAIEILELVTEGITRIK